MKRGISTNINTNTTRFKIKNPVIIVLIYNIMNTDKKGLTPEPKERKNELARLARLKKKIR